MRRGNGSAFAAALNALADTIYRLGQVPRRTAALAAPKLTTLLQRQFRDGVDPYGRPWAPLRPSTLAHGRRPPPLTDTRRLRDGAAAKVAPGGRAGIRLSAGMPYGAFAQVGFRVGRTRVPPRRIFPQFGMPRAWKDVLDAAARRAAREVTR